MDGKGKKKTGLSSEMPSITSAGAAPVAHSGGFGSQDLFSLPDGKVLRAVSGMDSCLFLYLVLKVALCCVGWTGNVPYVKEISSSLAIGAASHDSVGPLVAVGTKQTKKKKVGRGVHLCAHCRRECWPP